MNDVKFGINIPQFHQDESELKHLGDFSARTESLGFNSVWAFDGIFHTIPFLEPLTSLAYVAALTKKVKLGTAILRHRGSGCHD